MANEDLLLRQMPHSLEGEQAVLGSMLIDEGCVKDVMDKLVPSDFYLRQNREIFETIYTMFTYARPIDGITVCEEMQKAGTYDENTTRSYLAQLMEITPTSANVMEYVAIVRDKALLRGGAQAAGEITVLVQEGIGEAAAILEAAEQKIFVSHGTLLPASPEAQVRHLDMQSFLSGHPPMGASLAPAGQFTFCTWQKHIDSDALGSVHQ